MFNGDIVKTGNSLLWLTFENGNTASSSFFNFKNIWESPWDFYCHKNVFFLDEEQRFESSKPFKLFFSVV